MKIKKKSENDKFLVQFKNNVYDISEFAHKHPGGRNTLQGLNGMDMGPRFLNAPPHSDAAMYLLQEYKVDENIDNLNNNNETSTKNLNGKTEDIRNNGSTTQTDLNKEFFEKPDESMEVSLQF